MIDLSVYKQHIYDVIGAIHEVHKELGPGLNEVCYQEGMCIQFEEQGIEFSKELSFHPAYHGHQMESLFRVDFLCKKNIVIECKAVAELVSNHRAQLFNYMRLLSCPCGILVNFSPKFAQIERFFLDTETNVIIGTDGKTKQFL